MYNPPAISTRPRQVTCESIPVVPSPASGHGLEAVAAGSRYLKTGIFRDENFHWQPYGKKILKKAKKNMSGKKKKKKTGGQEIKVPTKKEKVRKNINKTNRSVRNMEI